MKIPPNISGIDVIKTLVKHYGWIEHRRKGSHVTLKKQGSVAILTVPLHKHLDIGTLLGIIRKADIERDDFLEKL